MPNGKKNKRPRSGGKYTRWSQRRLKRGRYVACLTSALTTSGPSPDSIWWDRERPEESCLLVDSVRKPAGKHRYKVIYQDGRWDWLSTFLKRAQDGNLILVGTAAPMPSATFDLPPE